MADALFRYLLMARERDHAWYRRAFLGEERLLAAGVERLLETAAVDVELRAQAERVTTGTGSAPASHAPFIRLYQSPEPIRPSESELEERVERFPMAGTLQTGPCSRCRSTGRVKCPKCQGAGEEPCPRCNGKGFYWDNHGETMDCADCGRRKVVRCRECHGVRLIGHDLCAGQGHLATWEEQVFTYSIDRAHELHVPPGSPAMRAAVEKWLESRDEVLTDLSHDMAVRRLGYDTPELAAMVKDASESRDRLKQHVEATAGRCLSIRASFRLAPVAACLARSESTSSRADYWVIGQAEDAIEIRPAPMTDRWKIAGWPGLVLGGLSCLAPVAASSAALEVLQLGVGAAGLAVAGVGLKRMLSGRRTPVRTVAIIPCGGSTTPYLICLATLGAFTRKFTVLDQSHRAHVEALMGRPHLSRQSRSVVIRLEDGQLVRLIELARPRALGREELRRIAEAVDGLVFLEEVEQPQTALRSRLHAATLSRPPEARVTIDLHAHTSDVAGLSVDGHLALEIIRKAFVNEIDLELEWPAVFQQLWAPVARIVTEGKRPELDVGRPQDFPPPGEARDAAGGSAARRSPPDLPAR